MKRIMMTAMGALLATAAAGCTMSSGSRSGPDGDPGGAIRGYAPGTPHYSPTEAQQSGCQERQETGSKKHASHRTVTPQNLSAGPHTEHHGEMGHHETSEHGAEAHAGGSGGGQFERAEGMHGERYGVHTCQFDGQDEVVQGT